LDFLKKDIRIGEALIQTNILAKPKHISIFDVLPHIWVDLINLAIVEIKASNFVIFWEESEEVSAEIVQFS
jgi:hypothetical protein